MLPDSLFCFLPPKGTPSACPSRTTHLAWLSLSLSRPCPLLLSFSPIPLYSTLSRGTPEVARNLTPRHSFRIPREQRLPRVCTRRSSSLLIAIEQLSDGKLSYSCSLGLFPCVLRSLARNFSILSLPLSLLACGIFPIAHFTLSFSLFLCLVEHLVIDRVELDIRYRARRMVTCACELNKLYCIIDTESRRYIRLWERRLTLIPSIPRTLQVYLTTGLCKNI